MVRRFDRFNRVVGQVLNMFQLLRVAGHLLPLVKMSDGTNRTKKPFVIFGATKGGGHKSVGLIYASN